MTARELARRLGVHESLVSLWLDDKRNISPEMLDKAEQELGLTPVNALDIRTVPGPLKPE
jgi:transcriptional regulator with XRE-family HTH domain